MGRPTTSRRIPGKPVRSLNRRKSLPQLANYRSRADSKAQRYWMPPLVPSVLVAVILAAAPMWLPGIRGVIPDRYIMAYAPEALQQMIFRIDVAEQVPIPAQSALEPDTSALLTALAPTPTASIAAQPAAPAQYLQPTRVAVAATPTMTPVVSMALNAAAQDQENEADLGNIDYLLEGFTWEQQGYNNCGPASLKVLMSYWGIEFSEAEAASYLKPNPEDPNVRPDEMAAYTHQLGYNMLIRVDGDFTILKQLIMAGYPVLIEAGYNPEPETLGWTSHYLPLVGFSDQGFIAMDTYRRPNWLYPYVELDYYWRQFNRRYLVAYRDNQAAAIASIVKDEMDDLTMYTHALQTAKLELTVNQDDAYAWFNLGSTLVALEQYEDAATAFDKALQLGLPWRFLWYQFTPFEAYLQVGRYQDVLDLSEAVLARKASEEPHYYKALVYAELDDNNEAQRHLTAAVRFNKNYTAAQAALDALTP
jgi:tetratricopeptide (TPR) repeat protein